MNEVEKQTLQLVLDGLMRRYQHRMQTVGHIISSMCEHGIIQKPSDIINDHIAFRTLGVPHLGIQSLEKIFLRLGYTKRDPYYFESKKLNAFWYSPPLDIPNLPRVFISECRVQDFAQPVQDMLKFYTQQVQSDPVDQLNLLDWMAVDAFLHQSCWSPVSWEDYELALNTSEYIAWVLNNQYYLNHFTISIHALKAPLNQIEQFNEFLESIGVVLNDAGGKIKYSGDGKLLQSASVSSQYNQKFRTKEGSIIQKMVPGSYVEFAQRIDGREGFDADNANNIFESTYQNQINKAS